MGAERAISVRSWQVGTFVVTMTVPTPKRGHVLNAAVKWAPHEPSRLTTDEWRQYRLGRNQAIGELAEELGITVAVLEL